MSGQTRTEQKSILQSDASPGTLELDGSRRSKFGGARWQRLATKASNDERCGNIDVLAGVVEGYRVCARSGGKGAESEVSGGQSR